MKLTDIIGGLEEVLPLLATMTGHPEVGVLATSLIDRANAELARRQADSGRSRSEELADAAVTYVQLKQENADLKKLGHEG